MMNGSIASEQVVEVVIRTDKGRYVGGDVIYGSLYLRTPRDCTATSLKLVLRGLELSEFDYHYVIEQETDSFQSKLGHRKARKDILRTEVKLVEHPGGFPEGCFAYPFRYQLPHGLAGVVNAKYMDVNSGRLWQALIKYTIGALLGTPNGQPKHKLLGETAVIVLEYGGSSRLASEAQVETYSASGCVRTFFCIGRGDINVTSRLDRRTYCANDRVTVHLNVENSSAVDVSNITIKVIRVIKLHGMDKERQEEELIANTIYDTILEIDHTGCPRNSTERSLVDLELEKLRDSDVGLPNTASGCLIKCNYVIDIDVHVPWAPDIEVRLPLIITPEANKQWEEWIPAKWVTDCSQQQVTGMCAVTPSILLSQSFSGMPSFQPIL